jgi:hypothetical protein
MRSPAISVPVDVALSPRELFEIVESLVEDPSPESPFTILSEGGLRSGSQIRVRGQQPDKHIDLTLHHYQPFERIEIQLGPPWTSLRASASLRDQLHGTNLRFAGYIQTQSLLGTLAVIVTWPIIWPLTLLLGWSFRRAIRQSVQNLVAQSNAALD